MRLMTSTLAGLFLASMLQVTAFAQNAHFVKAATLSPIAADGSITISFKEAGLGDNTSVTYVMGGNYAADYGCVNHGGKHPSASNKTGASGPVVASVSLPVGKNGSINGGLTFTPPDPNDVLSCPGNQVAVLADISYSGMTLQDSTNGVFADLISDFEAAVFFLF
jgi:hypothetical protein